MNQLLIIKDDDFGIGVKQVAIIHIKNIPLKIIVLLVMCVNTVDDEKFLVIDEELLQVLIEENFILKMFKKMSNSIKMLIEVLRVFGLEELVMVILKRSI